ncbi:MAG: hypothetical protein AB1817_03855 [Chloroflexota bacterium]
MAIGVMNKYGMRRITLFSRRNLTQPDRDFVAELVSEEARKTPRRFSFVFHDMFEGKHYCELFVEASQTALKNLLAVIESNLPYSAVVANLGDQKHVNGK